MIYNYTKTRITRKALGKSHKGLIISNKTFDQLPWSEAAAIYDTAAAEAEILATEQHQLRVEKFFESRGINPNSTDTTTQRDIVSVKRKAGQKALVEDFVEKYHIKNFAETLMPSIITEVGNMKTQLNSNGLISGLQFCKDNFNTPERMGLYRFLMLDSRSCYISPQYKGWARQFCALVPLILYAQRLVKETPYSAWDKKELRFVVNASLCDSMLWATTPDEDGVLTEIPNTEDILAGREKGLTVMSGNDAGKMRNPVSTWKLYSTKDTCFQGMPSEAQVMLAQIWCAHPANRTRYMVLDPKQWDVMPLPLIDTEVLTEADIQELVERSTTTGLPWE